MAKDNLHHPQAALAAEFALEGETGACTLAREWPDGADLADASTWAQVHGQPRTGPEALGWETPLEAYRPFLSYNELGSLLDEGPSKLYDALALAKTDDLPPEIARRGIGVGNGEQPLDMRMEEDDLAGPIGAAGPLSTASGATRPCRIAGCGTRTGG